MVPNTSDNGAGALKPGRFLGLGLGFGSGLSSRAGGVGRRANAG